MLAPNGVRPALEDNQSEACEFVSLDEKTISNSREPKSAQEHREEADEYCSIVCRLNDRWRIIICRDHLQFIVQHRRGERRGTPRWQGHSYCQTRDVVERVCRAFAGSIEANAQAEISRLPDHIIYLLRK